MAVRIIPFLQEKLLRFHSAPPKRQAVKRGHVAHRQFIYYSLTINLLRSYQKTLEEKII